MTEALLHGRLINAEGELLAEGPCWLDEAAGVATLEPARAASAIPKQRGALSLELENGRSLAVSDRAMVVRIAHPGRPADTNERRSLFRLRLLQTAQDADAAGAAGEGRPASPQAGLCYNGETPAAR